MGAVINCISQGACLICNLSDAIVEIDHLRKSERKDFYEVGNVVVRIASIACRSFDMALNLTGNMSPEIGFQLKNIELITKGFEIPFRITLAHRAYLKREISGFRCLEKIAATFVGFARITFEREIQEEKLNLLRYAGDPENAKRPIYKDDLDGNQIKVGEKLIDPKECEENIAKCEKCLPYLNSSEAALEFSVEKAIETLIKRIFPKNSGSLIEGVSIDRCCNLRRLAKIPAEIQNDEVFDRYRCPITVEPIRHIVQDPTTDPGAGEVFYEKSAIDRWISTRENPTSPYTDRPLVIQPWGTRVRPRPDLQAIIDRRLYDYEQAIRGVLLQTTAN